MSTKVKGEAIKEGSIPLSALSSEVQEKIENSGSKVFVFTYDMVKSENEDGSLTIDPANAIEMINSDFINMMDEYNMEKTHTYDDFAAFSLTLKPSPLMSHVIFMYVYSEGVIEIMSAGEEHPFVYDSNSEENENKVRKRLSLLDLALGDSDRKDYTEYIDEVKENVKKNLGITDAVTPNWNAQEGEAGYIENKPITKNFIKEQSMEFSDVDEWGSVYAGYDAVPSNTTVAKVFADITIYGGEHITTTVIVKKGESVDILINKIEDRDYLEISMYDTSKGLTMNVGSNFGFSGTLRCYYYEEFKQLDEDYIPDTVLKTTPQRLSADNKNQALANLGIDPVVWKYIMNPFVLQTGRIIPDELIASDGKSFKYSYAGMYKWAKGYAYDKDNFEYSNDGIGSFGSVHCPHGTMDYRDGGIFGAGNEIPPEGLPTYSSDMDDLEGPYGMFHDNWNSCFTTGAWFINKDTKQCYLSV